MQRNKNNNENINNRNVFVTPGVKQTLSKSEGKKGTCVMIFFKIIIMVALKPHNHHPMSQISTCPLHSAHQITDLFYDIISSNKLVKFHNHLQDFNADPINPIIESFTPLVQRECVQLAKRQRQLILSDSNTTSRRHLNDRNSSHAEAQKMRRTSRSIN